MGEIHHQLLSLQRGIAWQHGPSSAKSLSMAEAQGRDINQYPSPRLHFFRLQDKNIIESYKCSFAKHFVLLRVEYLTKCYIIKAFMETFAQTSPRFQKEDLYWSYSGEIFLITEKKSHIVEQGHWPVSVPHLSTQHLNHWPYLCSST